MNYFWLDTNAIVKQYIIEEGTCLINYFFNRVSSDRIFCLLDSIDETFRVFVKKRNGERITETAFKQAIQRFEVEFIHRTEIKKINATDSQKLPRVTSLRHTLSTTPTHISYDAPSIKLMNYG